MRLISGTFNAVFQQKSTGECEKVRFGKSVELLTGYSKFQMTIIKVLPKIMAAIHNTESQ